MQASTVLSLLAGVALPASVLLFVVSDRAGAWDNLTGIHHVLDVATRMESSYAPNIDRQIGPDEPAWKPILGLIADYSVADLPRDREPLMLARAVAVSSQKLDLGEGRIAEWTAPTTPIILIYSEWTGENVSPADYRVVGTIGDLRAWVEQGRSDRRFLIQDISLGFIALGIGALIWWKDQTPKDAA